MERKTPTDIGMPKAPPGFSEALLHTDRRTMQTVTLGKSGIRTYQPYEDPTSIIRCEVGSSPGDIRNFQLKQADGTWTEVISDVDRLPLIYREYLFHIHWLKERKSHDRRTRAKAHGILCRPDDIASEMSFQPLLNQAGRQKGSEYAKENSLSGYVAVSDSNRNIEFFLDPKTLTPSLVRIRLQDESWSPLFVFSLLPHEWQRHAQEYFLTINKSNARKLILEPRADAGFDEKRLKEAIGKQNKEMRYRLFMVVGTSGIGKDTVIDCANNWAREHQTDLRLNKSRSRVTDRKRRPSEDKSENIYVSKAVFTKAANKIKYIHPYQSRFDDRYAFDPETLLGELRAGNVTITVANNGHCRGVFEDIRNRLEKLGLPPPVLVLVDKDTPQTHVSIDGRDADPKQKAQRISTAAQFQDGFREMQMNKPELNMQVVLNNYLMFENSARRFLEILMRAIEQ